MTISELAIKRSTFVVVIFVGLSLLGLFCYSMLNYDLIPKVDMPAISISTTYSGASADEVESSVTKIIEDALSSLSNVKHMSSTSQEGMSIISIELEANTNTDLALQDAQRKINAIQYLLPEQAKTPSLVSFSSDDLPIIKFGITAKMDDRRLYQLVKDEIKPQLSKINGVGQVTLVGGEEREIEVNINRQKLEGYGLSVNQVYSAINNSNAQYATGKIEGIQNQYTVRLPGKLNSLEQMRNLIITTNAEGSKICLSDVAEVVDGSAEYTTLSRINGENSIGVQVLKQSDANSAKVCGLIKEEFKRLEEQYSSHNLKFNIASDNSVFTMASAEAVLEDLGIAIVLVALVMFLFLHSYRNSLIVLVSIPTSLISVFTGMYIFNFSLNMMTLMGLSLVIGILVDDSIVVLENITRHLNMGKDKRRAALDGRNEIGFTAVAITLVDVVVFVPMALVSGMIGNMLREFALVVVFSTLMSLIVSFTVTPLLASRLGKVEKMRKNSLSGKIGIVFESFYNKLLSFYEKVLRWGLAHRKTVLGLTTVLVFSSLLLVGGGFIGSEFMPNSDRGEFSISLEGESQNTLAQTNALTEKVEKILMSKPEVIKVYSNIGSSGSNFMTTSSEQHKSEITVTIVDKSKREKKIDQYAAEIKKEILASVPGLKVTSTPSSMMGSTEAPIQILLRGANMDELYTLADSITNVIKDVAGVNDIRLSIEKSKPELQISFERDKMSLLGLSVSDVGNTLQTALAGNTTLQFSEHGTDYNINLKFDKFDRSKVEDLKSIVFINTKGKKISLDQFATVTQELGPNKLERYNRISSLTIKAEVFGRPTGMVGEEIKSLISQKIHPKSATIEYKGQMERQAEAFGSLFFVLFVAVLLVYFVMVALYNSYLYPFVVLFSLPVAMIGAFLALALAGENLSIFSLIGLIMLMGLVAKNAILLVDFTNKLREDGKSLVEAIVEAGKERLRPILMTTIAMVFGMLPLAVSSGAASENRNGLAWVIIGGLTSSRILTFIVVATVYLISNRIKEKFILRKHKMKNESGNYSISSVNIVN